jgi:hypothetical protein
MVNKFHSTCGNQLKNTIVFAGLVQANQFKIISTLRAKVFKYHNYMFILPASSPHRKVCTPDNFPGGINNHSNFTRT